MLKKLISGFILSATIAGAGATTAQAVTGESCMAIGGVAVANFFAQGKDKPIVIAAILTGSLNSAAGKIIGQRKTATGLEMDMEHYFGRSDGGFMQTKDLGILTAIPGKPGRFMIEITYDIQTAVTRGTLNGYHGQFKSFGLVDLREPDDMKGLVRYSGKICK